LDIFEPIDEKLLKYELNQLGGCIYNRLQALNEFEAVYNRALKGGEGEYSRRSSQGGWRTEISTTVYDQAQKNIRNDPLLNKFY
jgi:hypothetical protein